MPTLPGWNHNSYGRRQEEKRQKKQLIELLQPDEPHLQIYKIQRLTLEGFGALTCYKFCNSTILRSAIAEYTPSGRRSETYRTTGYIDPLDTPKFPRILPQPQHITIK